MNEERLTITREGRTVARAAARMMATRARGMLADSEKLLEAVGDAEGAHIAYEAGETTTALIAATYDGKAQVFACKR